MVLVLFVVCVIGFSNIFTLSIMYYYRIVTEYLNVKVLLEMFSIIENPY